MFLYLSRHGQAAKPTEDEPSILTKGGRNQAQNTAQEMLKRHVPISQIWHSPKTRAVQTAEIYRSALNIPANGFIEKEALSIDGDVNVIYREILDAKVKHLLLVSHQPTLEELSSLLVAGSDHFPHIPFPTAGIALFEFDNHWQYRWSFDPSQLK